MCDFALLVSMYDRAQEEEGEIEKDREMHFVFM